MNVSEWSLDHIWWQRVWAPLRPREVESLEELITKINRIIAAQLEQNKRWRLESGLPEREPNELELLLQKWEESAREAPRSPAPEELVLCPEREEESEEGEPMEQEVQPREREVLLLATDKGMEG
ncbi:hypothetical protein EOD39_13036 [Acipenser ruthenus]|uniref:Uncharacterized protein n=1 Tax=Acipenser ruthenus TaxID=7906 RepID=A0A662YRE2_ACIRT|nr:hypothetical protein EOD39_13036 [Acipenser ruthenus]